MERKVEEAVIKIPEVALMFSKTGTAEVASDPMPPNVSDGFVILKEKDQWAEGTTKADVVDKIEKATGGLLGNLYEVSQPIQLRIKIGRASGRERVCQYVKISVVAVSLKKKTKNNV